MAVQIEEYDLAYSSNKTTLAAFFDNVVYWEIAKGTNNFYVTFEKGKFAIPNRKQESIATMEITYPHVTSNTGSLDSFISSSNRVGGRFDAFLEEEEKISTSPGVADHQNYNGFIPVTELQGSRYFESTLTSSVFDTKTYQYEVYSGSNSILASRTVSASYFYPFTNYQLSVLRKNATLIVDLDIPTELPDGIGNKGYAIIPQNLHQNIKDKLNEYLEAASNQINV